jgi:epoxyqueuosine reductase
LTAERARELARECGFELAGVVRAEPTPERAWYHEWVAAGFAGEMRYLADRRATVRDDPRRLLPSAKSVICVGRLYNTPGPYSTRFDDARRGWISRYAWGGDYHDEMRRGLARLDAALREAAGEAVESKICVDTAPLLERSYARLAGLGWIGRNTCLINQQAGSWFFLGELLVSLAMEPDAPPPDRCGTCRRCIDACPTEAIVPVWGGPPGPRGTPSSRPPEAGHGAGRGPGGPPHYSIDSRLCISYLTIELRGAVPGERRAGMGAHVFGCDICQDVCPWNRRAPVTPLPEYQPREVAPDLEALAGITEEEFRRMFGGTPVARARYSGFLRNVAIAMGNRGLERFRPALERLAASPDPLVAEHAAWALQQLR